MTLPSFDLGYGEDYDSVTSYDDTVVIAAPEDLDALKTESPSLSPRLRSLSDVSRAPTPAETSARITTWLETLAPPRDPSALHLPSASRHIRFPGLATPTPPLPRHQTSYLLSDSGSHNSLSPLPSTASDPEAAPARPATSIHAPPAPPPSKPTAAAPRPAAAAAPSIATLTILGPDLSAHVPRAGSPQSALLIAALLLCALVAPRIVFIVAFAYVWGCVSERAFHGARADSPSPCSPDDRFGKHWDQDEGVMLGRRLSRMIAA